METAYKLGITTVGISDITDYSYLRDFLKNRKKKNQACEFEEENIDKRLNAKNLFPKCKSIIAIAVPYGQGYRIAGAKDKGLLSVSSHGIDYHIRVNSILNTLAEELMKYIDFKYHPCVDTGPLIDKEVCRGAGLGNYGKNSLLINENEGSFINLGYLLTDIQVEGNIITESNICGTCNICVERCPNGAISHKGGINSMKCVSYLSQTKNYIPLDYRETMGRQIYGCDICQIVCPKNRDMLNKDTDEDYSGLLVDLGEILTISNRQFKGKYGHMAGAWRGRIIWKRNALISIANLKITSMFDNVKRELENPSPIVKTYAAWSLIKLNSPIAKDILYDKLKYEDESIRDEYLKLLEEL